MIRRAAPASSTIVLVVAALLAVTAVIASAQMRGRRSAEWCFSPAECPRTAYDGRFTFARVFFETRSGLGQFRGGGGEPPWHHDRPFAERNLSSILREISFLRTYDGAQGGNVVALSDPEMFRHPVLWLAEPGFWQPSEQDAIALRAYLLKGGFIIFDDFSGRDWYNFEFQMQRVLPEHVPIRLTGTEPIFRSFFDIDIATLRLNFDQQRGEYWGIFEDNDPTRRQMAMINYNNDIGEFMDYNEAGFYPVDLSNEAYKLATNYIIYALTH